MWMMDGSSGMDLRAPAKLNLYLAVLGRRPDGYHEIETLFERIDLADELTLTERPGGISLTCDDPMLPTGPGNLAYDAAALLQRESGCRRGVAITLRKRIPLAAGLGGGSSDAATALLGVTRLWGLELRPERLLALAGELGSDVPFFMHQVAFAIGRGRGERCAPLPARRPLAHVLVCPPILLSTQEIYQSSRFALTASRPSISIVAHALNNGSVDELATGLWNDLEPEAIRRCPSITAIQSHLRALGCVAVRLSGSGPAVFGLCRDLAHAQGVRERVRSVCDPTCQVLVVQTDGLPVDLPATS